MSIATRDLSVAVNGRTLFSGVNVRCEPGEIMALTGPSGSGKTTLLGCLGLLVKPTSGTVVIDGEPVAFTNRERSRFWRDSAAFVYQDYGVIEDESLAYNVALRGGKRALARNKRIASILEDVGLAERGGESAAVLSGGEKQRLGIARAVYKNARYVFADEPTASLDRENRAMVMSLMRTAASNGAAIIIATHDEELVTEADSVYDLATGEFH